MRAYAEETNRQNHERRAEAEADRRTLEKIERGLRGIMTAIEDGMYQPAMKARMDELTQQKAEIRPRRRPPEVSQARSYNEHACKSAIPDPPQ